MTTTKITLINAKGNKRIFHYVVMVEYKESCLFVWQDTMSDRCTMIPHDEYVSFKIEDVTE